MNYGRASLLTLFAVTGLNCSGPTEPDAIANIQVIASHTTIASGGTLQLNTAIFNRKGQTTTHQTVTWSSSDPTTATVSQTGLVTAGYNHTTKTQVVEVIATIGNVAAATTLSVAPDTTYIINTRLDEIRTALNDAFRLKFITNRVRAQYAAIDPQAWTGSFVFSPISTTDSLVFPSYYRIPADSLMSPLGKVTFGDHHTRWEYRVKVPSDTMIRAEYIWIQKDLSKHPIDTLVYRILQTQPYQWELESGNYIDSNIRVPMHVLPSLSPRWSALTKLRGYDRIERFLAGANSRYTYGTFATCFYQNVEDSLAYYFAPSPQADILHELKGYWLIEYPTYRRPVAFKFTHVVTTPGGQVTRHDSVVVVNTNPQTFVEAYNYGAMGGEAGVSIYTRLDSQKSPQYQLIVDRGTWTGAPSTTEHVTLIDVMSHQRLTITRPLHEPN